MKAYIHTDQSGEYNNVNAFVDYEDFTFLSAKWSELTQTDDYLNF